MIVEIRHRRVIIYQAAKLLSGEGKDRTKKNGTSERLFRYNPGKMSTTVRQIELPATEPSPCQHCRRCSNSPSLRTGKREDSTHPWTDHLDIVLKKTVYLDVRDRSLVEIPSGIAYIVFTSAST